MNKVKERKGKERTKALKGGREGGRNLSLNVNAPSPDIFGGEELVGRLILHKVNGLFELNMRVSTQWRKCSE